MAALAYLCLPVSGLAAYLLSERPRVRMHGLQAIALGLLWPAAVYAGSAISPGAAQITFGVGMVAWITFFVGTALGKDPHLPFTGRFFELAAAERPR
jgi:uncharacterized membrane protein